MQSPLGWRSFFTKVPCHHRRGPCRGNCESWVKCYWPECWSASHCVRRSTLATFPALIPASHAQSLGSKDNRQAAFQLFVAVPSVAVAPLPSSISFTEGAVLPLALSTAAAALYQPGYLELPFPSATTTTTTDKAKTLLIWGGSSSVGSAGVQLATASGITVFATASPRNFEFVQSLGAAQVFDHSHPDVVKQIVDALKGTELVGVYDAISYPDTVRKSAEVLKGVAVKGKDLVATVQSPPPDVPNAKGGMWF